MKGPATVGAFLLSFLMRASALEIRDIAALTGISTTSGVILGHPAPNRTGVTEFLGIPYAASTNGSRRWLPPQRFTSNVTFNASTYSQQGPSCPANIAGTVAFPNKTAQFDRIFLAFTTQGGNAQSEDCLSANIWVKGEPKRGNSKPVLVFFPGGRWNTGGSKSLFYSGQCLADAEDVIVVTINYRLNIFGFPGTPGIQQNAGLLDQRIALEWLRDNVAVFGGDSDRITVFGQSAGSVSVAYLAYAYPDDPIVAGYIMESGTPHSWMPLTPEIAAQHWYNASSTLGCGTSGDVLSCMQSKNTSEVLAAFAKVPFDPTSALYQPQFQPVEDNITVFHDYSALAAAGKFAKLPLLIGNNDFESGFYQIAAFATAKPFNATQQEIFNLEAFTCASAIEASARTSQNVTVYRYRYFGDFANLQLFPNSSTYHGSELEMIFGTAEDVSGIPNTAVEDKMSAYFMKVWGAFARDPENGLSNLGWPRYQNSSASTLVRLGYNDEVEPKFVPPSTSDAQCPVLGGAVDLGKGAM
ncbi:related to triacylglycerol lipase V precursor [Phialocephala subalpina]|uniref:Carboxylic ester hydrolase n=1 Tax=Phialocephala subalpina TaxID=576137 RepID=A0A1L7XTZ5_9HELO|nr:related to triacylglycerol lipase V precursor [Phialocephala subalpina]